MLDIKTVSVVGANGTMGSAIAGLVAAFGNAKVFLICRNLDFALGAVDIAADCVKAGSVRRRLIPKTYEDFESCISQSDWVFESVVESTEIKSQVLKRVSQCRKPGSIVTTGTSGFSINELAQNFDKGGRAGFFGTHFFNPPYSVPLCEVICSEDTEKSMVSEMKAYLKDVLYRDVIEATDTPGFLANRIGLHFLNKALQYSVKCKKEGGIDYIDSILGPFTGRSMTPLATVDFIGLDVHKASVDHIYANTADYDRAAFLLPEFVSDMVKKGTLGRKTKQGLFKLVVDEKGRKSLLVYDIESGDLRPIRKYSLPFANEMVACLKIGDYAKALQSLRNDASREAWICKHFLISYITYGLVISQGIAQTISDADIAMTCGYNWLGPVALMSALGGYEEVLKMAAEVDCEATLVKHLSGIEEKNKQALPPPFDYRKSLKASLSYQSF
jgi:3-hydroxyacyl-CoA dehydrogenase